MSCLTVCFCKKTAAPANTDIELEVSGFKNTKLYSYKELQIATNNFNPANKLGEGGFGSVYKGGFKDGSLAAVKVLSSDSRQGLREFLTEITVISRVAHANLVKLYGCCVAGNNRILVYEYLENNSLSQTLLGKGNGKLHFTWKTRAKICIGVAQGLAFLHEEVQPHIVHRDIKASNILLDKDFNPKISDFGLAKIFPPELTHISTHVAGTLGYLAPEYAAQGQLTRKADIYSFGVLLLEIVTGRSNSDRQLPEAEQYLLERTWNLYERDQLVKLLDTFVVRDIDVDEACRYLKIGLLCTQDMPKIRPSMASVVGMLTGRIAVDDKKVSKPGLISGLMGRKSFRTNDTDTASGSGKQGKFSSSENMMTSYATMTFSSIYDRSA